MVLDYAANDKFSGTQYEYVNNCRSRKRTSKMDREERERKADRQEERVREGKSESESEKGSRER